MIGPLSYIGGKHRLATKIISLIPKHKTYIEPFCGGAQVFFHKEPSAVEVLNDVDQEIVNFFRICQKHHEALTEYLKFFVVSRSWFEQLAEADPKCLTDIERAARFFVLQKTCYGGRVHRRNYAPHVIQPPSFNPLRVPALLETVHKRLARIQLECLPFNEVLKRYDRPTSFFYLDPPYYGINLYNHNLTETDFERLASQLGELKGKFILSLNNVPPVRKLFANFKMDTVTLPYTVQRHARRRFNELLISNY